MVSTEDDTAEPFEVPRPLARLLLMLFCSDCALVDSVVPVCVLLTGTAPWLAPLALAPVAPAPFENVAVCVPTVCAPEPPPRAFCAVLGDATRMVLLAVLPLAVPPAVLTQICLR